MTVQVILTVAGSDRPGLTQALADAVLAVDGNWLESHLTRLGGKYVGAVLVELAANRLGELDAQVGAIDQAGLHVTIVGAEAAPVVAGARVRLSLVGQDRPGIVREVTAALAVLDVNIEEFETATDNGAESGERLFRTEALLLIPEGTGIDEVQAALERISGEIMVDFTVSPGG